MVAVVAVTVHVIMDGGSGGGGGEGVFAAALVCVVVVDARRRSGRRGSSDEDHLFEPRHTALLSMRLLETGSHNASSLAARHRFSQEVVLLSQALNNIKSPILAPPLTLPPSPKGARNEGDGSSVVRGGPPARDSGDCEATADGDEQRAGVDQEHGDDLQGKAGGGGGVDGRNP